MDPSTYSISQNNTTAGPSAVFLPWKNPYNVITFETYILIENILVCFFNPLMLCVGVPTNILNCIVFARQGLRDRMNLCLFCLALVDLLFVTLCNVCGSYCWVGFFRPDLENWWKWWARKYVIGSYQGFLMCSGCIVTIISVERCVCVFLPLKASSLMKTRTMAVMILTTVVSIQLLCLTYPLQMDVVLATDPVLNTTDYQLVPASVYIDNLVVFDFFQKTVLLAAIPFSSFIIVSIATTITVVQLKRKIAWRARATSVHVTLSDSAAAASSRQMALVKMLVIVSVIFILTSSPMVALSTASNIQPEIFINRRYNNVFLATHSLYIALCLVNSSVNFFVYLIRSSRFRKELAVLPGFAFCGKGKKDVVKVGTSASLVSGTLPVTVTGTE